MCSEMTGIQYTLHSAKPPHLYIILKSKRDHPKETPTNLQLYYIIGGTVFQAPSLHDVLTARLVILISRFLISKGKLHRKTYYFLS